MVMIDIPCTVHRIWYYMLCVLHLAWDKPCYLAQGYREYCTLASTVMQHWSLFICHYRTVAQSLIGD